MSGAEEGGFTPQQDWNVQIEPGDECAIFEKPYFFDRVDRDDAVEFRAPLGADYGDFRVIGADSHPRKPTKGEVATMWVEGNFRFVEKPLNSAVRQHVRNQDLDHKQAQAIDEYSTFRVAALRRYDESPWARSEGALRAFNKMLLDDPKIAKLPGARMYDSRTWRTWIDERGTPDCRKACDGISMRGRYARKMKIKHPLEIVMYWASRAVALRGDIVKNHDRYVADLYKINRGEELNRNFWIDPDGEQGPCERKAEYPKPVTPYAAISYRRFARLCRSLTSPDTNVTRTTRQGAYQRYGGGGLSDLPTHLGAFCWIDDSPIPKVMFFDEDTGIPMGQCTLSLMLEQRSRVVPGWDIHPGAPSAATAIRTVLSANLPNVGIPQYLLDIDPNLPWLRLKPGIVGFDNSTGNHSRSAEEMLSNAYIGSRFFGADMPRDKSHMERVIQTFLDLVFEHMEGAHYDIARMRRYKFNEKDFFDPKKHLLISIQSARRLLLIAVMTYNVTRHRGLDNRQPGLVWKQLLGTRKLDKVIDEQALADSACNVDFDMQMTNAGIEKFNRRFTPGAVEMKRILSDFERGTKLSKGDIGHKPKHSRDDRKRLSYRVKGRYNGDDIGTLRIWNPFFEHPNGMKGQWEVFSCTDPAAHGLPLWLHNQLLAFAQAEAMEYATPEQQAYVRAKLFEHIASIDSKSADRERKILAKVADHPHTRQVLKQIVEVRDEEVPEHPDLPPEAHPPVSHHSAEGRRKDATVATPRAGTAAPQEPQKLRPRKDAPVVAPAPAPAPEPRRRRGSTNTRNDSHRTTAAQHKSAERPDQRAPRRRRSNLKMGDDY